MNAAAEWLEADGLGGFASGTAGGIRTRRYHALLLAAAKPPTSRFVLVNGIEAWVERDGRREAISSHWYLPAVRHPDGADRLESFTIEPWPTWRYLLSDGTLVVQELFAVRDTATVVLAWRLATPRPDTRLLIRPLLSGRDYHALHFENPAFRFHAVQDGDRVTWTPYDGVPAIHVRSNGRYRHEPLWYRGFLYEEDRARGLDHVEDLASPGEFTFDLEQGEALMVFEALVPGGAHEPGASSGPLQAIANRVAELRARERDRRLSFPSPLHRAAEAYLVRRGSGRTIIAGYPWFADWGRDTFIALRGLCLATGRLAEAGEILNEWAGAVSQGMLPNRFADSGEDPEYNAVDASLWYVIAVHEYLQAAAAAGRPASTPRVTRLHQAVDAILAGYAAGTRYGIRLDADGLLACGVPGVQLTWMDAKVGDWVVTPRIGKPVEVQALWLNALRLASARVPRWAEPLERGLAAFVARFPNQAGHLHDVVDVDHEPGTADSTFRPNQILAAGGLPFSILPPQLARAVVDAVEARLLTPIGLRSLDPGEPGYTPRYEGGPLERDGSYHQGTVWPWLMGPFVEAWVRVRGDSAAAKNEARRRFLQPLLQHMHQAGLGHLPEIADADPPHQLRGALFQAWSAAEALRLDRVVLGGSGPERAF